MRLVRSFVLLALVPAAFACSKLTSPPAPEPIASDTPVTSAAPAGSPTTVARPRERERQPEQAQQQQPEAEPEGDLKIEDLVVGKGPAVKPGDVVVVHYTGTLLNGTKFDSSHDHPAMGGQPAGAPMTLGIPGPVIKGWNKGIPGMRVGGKRKLTIPPSLAYGRMGKGPIPPNATLVFVIELVEIKSNAHAAPLPKGP